ncbi:glycosyltransferase [Tomitella fengzijianii]|uniref:glycosyltransferase n=1 Tax=Tomitella fengzijianii TaxID=2597660 RepID=UPI001AEFE89A|nr:glycosyltransferase [Tomitella fengzijianii]
MNAGARLRVLYVVPDLVAGGAERHVVQVLPCLDPSAFITRVVCIGQEGRLFADLIDSGAVTARALHRSRWQAIQACAELVREMKGFRPDIVLVRGYNAEVLGRIGAAAAHVPHTVVWAHDCRDGDDRSRLRRLLDMLLEPITDAYFGVAEAQRRYLVEDLGHPARKVRIIRNGVDPSALDPRDDKAALADFGVPAEAPVVGIVAALRPEKDHELFLDAARRVLSVVADAHFLVVGGGARRERLESLACVQGLRERVVFTGDREDVPSLLRAMDVVVLCSRTVECFPISLLEAMAAGRPVVSTAVGGVPEIVADGVTGYLVPIGDAASLAARVIRLLRDPAQCRKFGSAARARVQSEFTLDRAVAGSEQALKEVAHGLRAGAGPVRLTVVLDQAGVGGIEVVLLEMFKAFDPVRVRPRLVCLREGGALSREFREQGFEVTELDRSGRYDMRTLPRLVRLLRKDRTDAVLVTHHHHASLALGRLAALAAHVPVNLVAVHDMDLTSVGDRCLPRWAMASLFLSTAVVLLSEKQGEYLEREEGMGAHWWSRTRSRVIANGTRILPVASLSARAEARVLMNLPADAFVVGMIARLSEQKAHEVAFEAVARAADAHPELHLALIGGGEREGELRALADRAGIGGRTVFLGRRRDVPRLLPGLDVSCLSSVHEGAPMTVLESMTMGLPVVATDCGCLAEMIIDGEHGFIVDVGDSEALGARLVLLAQDPDLRARMGARARARVQQRYRIDQTADGYARLLQTLLGRSTPELEEPPAAYVATAGHRDEAAI